MSIIRKSFIILSLVFMVLISSGCIGGGQTTSEVKTVVATTQPPQTTSAPLTIEPIKVSESIHVYYIDIHTEKKDEGILVFGDTNIPEGSKLFITVSRKYKRRDGGQNLAGLTEVNDVVVSSGKISKLLVPTDMDVYSSNNSVVINAITRELESLKQNNDLDLPGIKTISDFGTVYVAFNPKAEQPDSVYQILGQNFENLVGDDVHDSYSGEFKLLSVKSDIELRSSQEIEEQKAKELEAKLKETEAKQREYEESIKIPLELNKAWVDFNSIGNPEAHLVVKNLKKISVDAYTVGIYCYNRYGEPVNHYAYSTNRFGGLSQRTLVPGGTEISVWTLHGHENTAKIKVVLEKVHMTDGTVWTPGPGQEIAIEGVSTR